MAVWQNASIDASNAHELFDGKSSQEQGSENLKDVILLEEKEQKRVVKSLQGLKGELLGDLGVYPDFIKTLAQQKRNSVGLLGGIPRSVAKIWGGVGVNQNNPLLLKIDDYMKTNGFRLDCINAFENYAAPSITDFVYLIKSIGKNQLSALDNLSPGFIQKRKNRINTPQNRANLAMRQKEEPQQSILTWLTQTSDEKPEAIVTDFEKKGLSDKVKESLRVIVNNAKFGKYGTIYATNDQLGAAIVDEKSKIITIELTKTTLENTSMIQEVNLTINDDGTIPNQYVPFGDKDAYVFDGNKFQTYQPSMKSFKDTYEQKKKAKPKK